MSVKLLALSTWPVMSACDKAAHRRRRGSSKFPPSSFSIHNCDWPGEEGLADRLAQCTLIAEGYPSVAPPTLRYEPQQG